MDKKELYNISLFNDYEDVLTVKELMQILKIGRNSCYELLKNGSISAIKVGTQYRIPKTNLIEFLQNS